MFFFYTLPLIVCFLGGAVLLAKGRIAGGVLGFIFGFAPLINILYALGMLIWLICQAAKEKDVHRERIQTSN